MEITERQVDLRCSTEGIWGVSGAGAPMLSRDVMYDIKATLACRQ